MLASAILKGKRSARARSVDLRFHTCRKRRRTGTYTSLRNVLVSSAKMRRRVEREWADGFTDFLEAVGGEIPKEIMQIKQRVRGRSERKEERTRKMRREMQIMEERQALTTRSGFQT